MYMNDGNKTKINLRNKSVFITGVAGFIGSNLAKRLLSTVEGVKVVGLDNMNHYYDVRLKEARLNELEQFLRRFFWMNNLQSVSIVAAFPIGAVIVMIVVSFMKDAKKYMEGLEESAKKKSEK